ncbi:hypothetical protein ABZS76_27040 [Streptomyces sp. NPDC005562]|uniref:hypothetical protein n=1 Tax=unclassified Streptomyces TaxID=2593676 RepID=UPI00339F69FA
MSVGLLVWRIVDGDSVARIAVSAVLVLAAIVLLVANHRNRRDEPGGREGSG